MIIQQHSTQGKNQSDTSVRREDNEMYAKPRWEGGKAMNISNG